MRSWSVFRGGVILPWRETNDDRCNIKIVSCQSRAISSFITSALCTVCHWGQHSISLWYDWFRMNSRGTQRRILMASYDMRWFFCLWKEPHRATYHPPPAPDGSNQKLLSTFVQTKISARALTIRR